jgi:hypothetical protein
MQQIGLVCYYFKFRLQDVLAMNTDELNFYTQFLAFKFTEQGGGTEEIIENPEGW